MKPLYLLALLLPFATTACTEAEPANPDTGDEPVEVVEILEQQHFDDLAQMVASSDLVLIGEVLEVAPGEIRGVEEDGTGGIQFAETTIQIKSVMSGAVDTDTVVIESLGWADYGRHYTFADGSTHQSHTPGESAIFHLVRTKRPDDRIIYRLTNSQGKYVIGESGTITATKTNDELATRVSQLGLTAFEAQVATMARPD